MVVELLMKTQAAINQPLIGAAVTSTPVPICSQNPIPLLFGFILFISFYTNSPVDRLYSVYSLCDTMCLLFVFYLYVLLTYFFTHFFISAWVYFGFEFTEIALNW